MFRRTRHLFKRYADQHYNIYIPGQPLVAADGKIVGYLEQARYRPGAADLQGWISGARLSFGCDAQSITVHPNILRTDVSRHLGEPAIRPTGFQLTVPVTDNAISATIQHNGQSSKFQISVPNKAAIRGEQRRLMMRFVRDAAPMIPHALRWVLTGSATSKQAIKSSLGLHRDQAKVPPVSGPIFVEMGATKAPNPNNGLTIILPVFNAFDLLGDTLNRITLNTDLPWHLIVVEDCSTDARVRPWLRHWINTCADGHVTLIENNRNLGFVGSVNAALSPALDRGNHVVLLNSDAHVPAGWASRLLAPILADAAVASTTPMSNSATIMTMPSLGGPVNLSAGQVDRLDDLAARMDPGLNTEIPTGIGFCMGLNIDFLRKVREFDPAFGRGYGEEVDWSQKCRRLGGRHVGIANLFVEHVGGASFGSDEKRERERAAAGIIRQRYPQFDQEVQTFIKRDPLSAARFVLAVAWANALSDRPVPIYVAHSMGGGAEIYLKRRIKKDLTATGRAIVLRVGGDVRWQIELHAQGLKSVIRTDDLAVVQDLISPVKHCQLIYSCGVGDRNPVELPDMLLALISNKRAELEVLFHDFFPISPSYNLLDKSMRFSGVPKASDNSGADGELGQWQTRWRQLLNRADRLIAFSHDSKRHILAAYPDMKPKLSVLPHTLPAAIKPVTTRPIGRATIGVLGSIGYEKGAAIVSDLSRYLHETNEAGLVLVGHIDPAYRLYPTTIQHGRYSEEEITRLAEHHGISHWLIPSIWPETFSFTTHEALATGLPVFCFDLGAQAEAVRNARATTGLGGVLPIPNGPADLAALTSRILSARHRAIRAA